MATGRAWRPSWLFSAISIGLITGVGMIYLAMVGLVEAFADRPAITGVGGETGPGLVTLARVMLGGTVFLGAAIVASRTGMQGQGGRRSVDAVYAGTLVGLIA